MSPGNFSFHIFSTFTTAPAVEPLKTDRASLPRQGTYIISVFYQTVHILEKNTPEVLLRRVVYLGRDGIVYDKWFRINFINFPNKFSYKLKENVIKQL